MKKIIITGASGFIGRALCIDLCKDYKVVALSRDARRAANSIGEYAEILEWDSRSTGTWAAQAEDAFAIINLAGENIAAGRWNEAKKAGILQSRLSACRAITSAIKHLTKKPSVVITASAIGYYGTSDTQEFTEQSPAGRGFLADVCQKVELCAQQIETTGVRLVIIRSGVVLDAASGALPRLAMPFKYYLGGCIGTGRQWFSWICLDDEIRAIRYLLENENQRGVFNLTAPQPVTNKQLSRSLGRAMKRPALLPLPAFILRLGLGEMADEMLLSGQKVLPQKLLDAGFEFEYPEIKKALTQIYNRKD